MKKRSSIVAFRWGAARAPSALVRVSRDVRELLDTVPDVLRREFVDYAVRSCLRSNWWRTRKREFDKGVSHG